MLIDLKTIKTVPRLILELNVLFNFAQPAQSTCTEGNSNNCSASSLVIIFPACGPYICGPYIYMTGRSHFFLNFN